VRWDTYSRKPPLTFADGKTTPTVTKNVKILQTLSIDGFKKLFNCEVLLVIKNAGNKNNFITANNKVVAACSRNYSAEKPKEFIQIVFDNAAPIWVLHNINAVLEEL